MTQHATPYQISRLVLGCDPDTFDDRYWSVVFVQPPRRCFRLDWDLSADEVRSIAELLYRWRQQVEEFLRAETRTLENGAVATSALYRT